MNKKDLVKAVAEARGISRAEAIRQVDAVLGAITDALQASEKVRLPGFGTFEVGIRAARTARNPRTGGTIEVQAASVPRFRAAPGLKEAVAEFVGGATAELDDLTNAKARIVGFHERVAVARRSHAKRGGPRGPGGGSDK